MKIFMVTLNRTCIDACTVAVEADDAKEAMDLAIDEEMGQHEWDNQETIDIRAVDVFEVKNEPL